MAETVVLDPTSEDATNVQVDLTGTGYVLLEQSYNASVLDRQRASSASTEGELFAGSKPTNRQIPFRVDCQTKAALTSLEHKLTKFDREGGTVKRTLGDGTTIVFDVLGVSAYDAPADHTYVFGGVASVSFTLECKPYGRGTPVVKTLHSEATLPALIFTETIPGSATALGKLTINEAQGQDQWWVVWGQESRYYSSSANAALLYEAESRTPLGVAATAVGPTGASGTGSNVVSHTAIPTVWTAILSTQASGGGAHLSHIGDFRVFARMQAATANATTVSVALEWAEGDFRSWTRNAEYLMPKTWDSLWQLVDLGQVHLTKVAAGTQRWEGRIVAKSTNDDITDDLHIDYLMLVPITEGSGEAVGVASPATPTSFTARDEFNQTAGALNGKALPAGGTWATSGDATDFSVFATVPNHWLERTTTSGTNGRYAIAGTATPGSVIVQTNFQFTTTVSGVWQGVIARWTDANNYLRLFWHYGESALALDRFVAGVQTRVATSDVFSLAASTWYTMKLVVDANGIYRAYIAAADGTPDLVLEGLSSTLATGGTLATGKVGLWDNNDSVGACTRRYDGFMAWVPVADAAMFASQSLEVRHDQVIREDAGGTLWQGVSSYEGDYLRIPPAGKEARTLRMIVKATRNDPNVTDPALDDISAQLTVTPRWWIVPE